MIALVAFLLAAGLCLLAWSLFAIAIRNALPMLAGGAVAWATWETTETITTSAMVGLLAMLSVATLLEVASRMTSLRFPVMLAETLTASVIVGALASPINSGGALDTNTALLSIGASGGIAGMIVYRKHALN